MNDNLNAEKSKLFLEYIQSYGFNPNNYERILEILQSADGSMSQFLTDYRQYLLSRQVDYSELDVLGIDGANGYIENGDILVPKSIYNDYRFLYSRRSLRLLPIYGVPTIDDFDVMIANSTLPLEDSKYSGELLSSLTTNLNLDKYLGLCISDDDQERARFAVANYKRLTNALNAAVGEHLYTFENDTAYGNQLCLIKRSK